MRIIFTDNDGEILINREIVGLLNAATDFRQLAPGLIPEVQSILREQFNAQGNGASGQWAELSPAYARWKEKNFPGKPILQRSGETFRALTGRTENSILETRSDSITFGVRLPYPIFHQRGGKRLPRRPIFDFNETQKRRLIKVVQRRILSAGRNNGATLS